MPRYDLISPPKHETYNLHRQHLQQRLLAPICACCLHLSVRSYRGLTSSQSRTNDRPAQATGYSLISQQQQQQAKPRLSQAAGPWTLDPAGALFRRTAGAKAKAAPSSTSGWRVVVYSRHHRDPDQPPTGQHALVVGAAHPTCCPS